MQAATELSFASTTVEDLAIQHQVDVNPLTGAALVRVPLPLTSGRSDFGPSLGLEYNSSTGNSAFGVGWSLTGLPTISIDTRKALPRYDDRDSYVSNGGGELVPVLHKQPDGCWRPIPVERGDHWVQYFRSKVEQGYTRFERWVHKTTGLIHWRSRDADDVVTIYGLHPSGYSRISDPDDQERTYLWLPDAQYDSSGNAILYEYASENRDRVDAGLPYEATRVSQATGFAQRYLKRIRYGNTKPLQPDVPVPTDNSWLFEVVLDFGDHDDSDLPASVPDRTWPVREDPFSSYRPGFEVRTYRLCRRVLMFHHFDELGSGPTLVGATRLEHDNRPSGSTLLGIHYIGYRRDQASGQTNERSLPPLRFTYSAPNVAESFEAAPEDTEENVPYGLSGPSYQLVDLFGEGLPGILSETDQAWYYKPNEGGGHFGPQQLVSERPSQRSVGRALGDFDRDGNTNLVVLQGRQAGFYEFDRNTDRWDGFRAFSSLPHLEAAGPKVQWLDLNGDGRPELMVPGQDRLTWYPSLGKGGFGPAVETSGPQANGTPSPQHIAEDPDLRFFFADMNGDGLVDQVRIQNGRVEYWPQIGNGRFGDAVLMEDSPVFAPEFEFDASRLQLVDIDGSGTTDLLYVGHGEVRYWINASGNRLIEGGRIATLPYIDDLSTVRVLDFLGDGTPCLVWSSPLSGRASPIHYLQLTRGAKPRLLLSVDNSMGREVRLTYGSSASHYLRDKQSGRGWTSKLPSHTTIVDTRETIDHVGGSRNVSNYEYHDGHFDGEEQAFRGFGLVDQYDAEVHGRSSADPEAAFSAPTCVRTWFHTGSPVWDDRGSTDRYSLDGEQATLAAHAIENPGALRTDEYEDGLRALAGQVIRQEVFATSPTGQRTAHPYQVTQSSYRLRRLQPGDAKHDACFTFHLSERVTYDYEQQPDDPRVSHHLTLDVDPYGNAALECAIAYARRPSQPSASEAQRRHFVSAYEHRYINVDEDDRRELGIPVESKEFEISGLSAGASGLFQADDLRSKLAPALAAPLAYHESFAASGVQARVVGWDRSYYWNDGSTAALSLGAVGAQTLLHHEESACFTDALVGEVFGSRVSASMLKGEGGYVQRDGYWWQPDPVHYHASASGFFHLVRIESWDGGTTTYTYDTPYFLTPIEVRDDLGNRTTAEIDYHLVAPERIIDPNDNVAEVLYDSLGVVVVSSMHGDVLGSTGDVESYGHDPISAYVLQHDQSFAAVLAEPDRFLQNAGQFVYYDLDTWADTGSPPRTLTLLREQFVHDGQAGSGKSRIQVAVEYLDGFGRTLQSKLLAEPGPAIQRDSTGRVVLDLTGAPVEAPSAERWLVSGHVVYNNKQQPVRQYEPYYSSTHAFEPDEELSRFGVSQELHYDAIGRLIRENSPNGTYSEAEYVPWEVRRHDPNDTVQDSLYRVLREGLPDTHTEKQALQKAQEHADTPTVVHLDPQGQEVKQVVIGIGGTDKVTENTFDIRGNLTEVIDPRGLTAFRYRPDMQGRVLYQRSADAGETRTLPDASDRPIHHWDSRGMHQRRSFDTLDRPVSVHVDGALGLNQMVEQMVYGEDPPVSQAGPRNARGRLVMHRDQAGVLTIQQYDPAGNVLRSERLLRQGYKTEPNWTNLASVSLEPTRFESEIAYDALGRVRREALPDGTVRHTEYLRGGGIERLRLSTTDGKLNDLVLLSASSFNARGQRTRAVLGNGVEIEHRYDPETFRTNRITALKSATSPTGSPRTLQDIEYTYDPVGNITRALDHAQQPATGPAPVVQGLKVSSHADFTYDAFYQLTQATGRVHQSLLQHDYRPGLKHPGGLKGTRHLSLNNGQAVERYTRTYEYDLSGNVERTHHQGATRSWSTEVWTSPSSNRSLPATNPAGNPTTKRESRFDSNGNCIYLVHLRALRWDYRNSLASAVLIKRPGNKPDDAEYYVYGGDGLRVRKVSEKLVGGELEITEKIYLDGCEIKRIRRGDQLLLERTTSHVSEGDERIALVHRWTKDQQARETDDISQPKIHYQLTNHLGSSVLELDGQANIISYEEYFPYGGTAFIAGNKNREVNLKEYRYTGKERDDATGLYYFGYRYYAPWIGKWLSPDPLGPEDSPNLYQFALNNPVNFVDPDGLRSRTSTIERDVPARYISFEELPAFLQTEDIRAVGYQLLRDPGSGEFIEVTSVEDLYAGARKTGGVIEIYDPKWERVTQTLKESLTELNTQIAGLGSSPEQKQDEVTEAADKNLDDSNGKGNSADTASAEVRKTDEGKTDEFSSSVEAPVDTTDEPIERAAETGQVEAGVDGSGGEYDTNPGSTGTTTSSMPPATGTTEGMATENATDTGSAASSVAQSSPSAGEKRLSTWEILKQVPDFPWAEALGMAPEMSQKTREERIQITTEVFERAGASPETAKDLGNKYISTWGDVGTSVGGMLGPGLFRPFIAPVPRGPYVGPRNPFARPRRSDTISSSSPVGNPRAIVKGFGSLSNSQKAVLAQLPRSGSRIIVPKKAFGQKDLAALTAATGDEFAMFTAGGRRLIIRGTADGVPIGPKEAATLARQGWRWSAHTHPGTTRQVLRSSGADRKVLEQFRNKRSAIRNSEGDRRLFTPAGDDLGGYLP